MNKFLLGLAGVSALMMASGANAALELSVGFDYNNNNVFTDVGDVIITDQLGQVGGLPGVDLLGDLNPTAYAINAQRGFFQITNGGSIDSNPLNLHMTAATTAGFTGTMTFGTTVTGVTLADISSAVFSMGGSGFDSATASAYIDMGNVAFGMGDLIGTINGNGPSFSFLSTQYGITDQDEFSLTLISTITADGAASIDSDVKVPEPSIVALFGAGLIGLGVARRRMKK